MKSLIRRQIRKHSPELANLDNKRRRYAGQARRYKGKANRYGKNIRLPKGFTPPRGMKLLNPNTAGTAPPASDDGTVNSVATDDNTGDKTNNIRRLLVTIVAVVATLIVLTVIGLVLVPRAVDWWQDRGSTDTTTVVTQTAPSVNTTVPTATATPAPVVFITEWGLGSCVTTSDAIATPATCTDADLVVTAQVDHPADPLTSDEITEIQTRLTELGVDINEDGVLGPQTLTAMSTAALTAGLDADANNRAILAVIRSLGLDGALTPDGPRPIQNTPDVCGDASSWVATPTVVLCLGPR